MCHSIILSIYRIYQYTNVYWNTLVHVDFNKLFLSPLRNKLDKRVSKNIADLENIINKVGLIHLVH
jgi:hypothetical protein